jgi:DNA-directed RNA polymerase subunit RPC12/RpoP
MKLEFHKIAGEEVPFIVLECVACGEEIAIQERDVKTTKPFECASCHHRRSLSYREFVTIADRFSAPLLRFLILKRKAHSL